MQAVIARKRRPADFRTLRGGRTSGVLTNPIRVGTITAVYPPSSDGVRYAANTAIIPFGRSAARSQEAELMREQSQGNAARNWYEASVGHTGS
jgi:hypothetical protein